MMDSDIALTITNKQGSQRQPMHMRQNTHQIYLAKPTMNEDNLEAEQNILQTMN